MTNIASNCKAFCEVCGHGVYNLEKHLQSEDHKRNLRKEQGVILMAAKAFVLIETVGVRSKEVVTALKQVEGVEVDTVTGPYDVIAVVAGETLNDIGDLITAKIHPIAGISRTVTCLVMEDK